MTARVRDVCCVGLTCISARRASVRSAKSSMRKLRISLADASPRRGVLPRSCGACSKPLTTAAKQQKTGYHHRRWHEQRSAVRGSSFCVLCFWFVVPGSSFRPAYAAEHGNQERKTQKQKRTRNAPNHESNN